MVAIETICAILLLMPIFRQRLTQNTFALLISSGGSTILSLLLFSLIGRVTGESGLGIYATVLAWIFPLSIIAEFGLSTLITRDVAQSLESTHVYLLASVKLRFVFGGILSISLFLAAPLISDNLLTIEGLRIAAPLILILPLYGSLTAIFRAHQRMQPIAWLNIGMLVAQVSLTALIFATGGDVLVALWINTLTSLGQLLIAIVIYARQFYRPTQEKITLRPFLQQAFPFAIAAILGAVQLRMDVILLEQFAATTDVGYYAAALRFLDAGRLVSRAFLDALFPAFAERIAQNTGQILLRRVAIGVLSGGVILAIFGILLSEWVLILIYGERFAPATPILQIMAVSFLPMVLRQLRMLYGFAQGDTTYINALTLITLALQFGLSLWVLPRYGAIGAAGVILLVEIIGAVLLWLRPHSSTSA